MSRGSSPAASGFLYNAVEVAEDQDGPSGPLGLPAGGGLERLEDLVEPVAQVLKDVIPIMALAMSGVQGGSRPANQDGAGQEVLEVSLGSEQLFPVR